MYVMYYCSKLVLLIRQSVLKNCPVSYFSRYASSKELKEKNNKNTQYHA